MVEDEDQKVIEKQHRIAQHIENLETSVLRIQEALAEHAPHHHGWGKNPVFEEKLKLRQKLTELSKQQEYLAEGVVSLLRRVNRLAEDESDKANTPPVPKPSQPAMPPAPPPQER